MSTNDRGDALPMYWWAKEKNFGDLIGPWMVEAMSGRPVRNIAGRRHPQSVTGLSTVGSLLQSFDRPGLEVWGTGSIRHISKARAELIKPKTPSVIHALRGRKTHWLVRRRLGWDAPEVFGDPAILMPRLYTPRPRPDVAGKTAIVAHYIHKESLGALDRDRFHWVDVQDDPDVVLDQIAAADRVVSSSLHGLIIAGAYGVPWVWLSVGDEPLTGGRFKFEDYFTILERDKVSEALVRPEEVSDDLLSRIADTATLPAWTTSHDDLWNAFPYHKPG